jgi:hypothetical protein
VSKSEDIHTLFRRFGGDADSYQEIVSTDYALSAEQKWPMLGQLKTRAQAEAPPARRAVLTSDERKSQVEVVIYKNIFQESPVATEASPFVVAQATAEPELNMPVQLVQSSMLPVSVAVAPMSAQLPAAVPLAGAGASPDGLKAVFDRMLPRGAESAPVPASRGLKRLVKW